MALLVAWLAAELQCLGGARIERFAAARDLDGGLRAVCGYQNPVVGKAAMIVAARIIGTMIEPGDPYEKLPPIRRAVANVVDLGHRGHFDHVTRVMVERAVRRGIPHYRVLGDYAFLQFGQGARQQHFLQVMSGRFEHLGILLCEKQHTHAVLRRLGVPVAAQRRVSTVAAAQKAAKELGGPVVVKPDLGHGGAGVTVGITDPAAIAAAFRKAEAANAGDVLVESFVAGDDYRLLLVDGRLVAAARRIPGHVVGDGVRSVETLLAALNRDENRTRGEQADRVWIELDDEAERLLARRGYDRASVPPAGEVVFLRAAANISMGGTVEDVLHRVHPGVRQLAETIARAFRLEIMAIDYLSADIGRPPDEAGGVVCEVNQSPGLRPHADPPEIRERIVDMLLDRHFPPGEDGRIPVALVAGGSGRIATARMLAAMLEASGKVTGLAVPPTISVGGRVFRHSGSGEDDLVRNVLFDPTAEAAVLAVGAGAIRREGLPVDRADAVAVLDVRGEEGVATDEEMARIQAVVVGAATRVVVLDADDAACAALAGHAAAPVIWTSLRPDNAAVAAHVRAGGAAAHVDGAGAVVVSGLGGRVVVATDADVRSAIGGETAPLRSALAAVALAHGLGLSRDAVAAGLAAAGAAPTRAPAAEV